MGFLEIAAAMKFISNVDLIWGWGIFTREVCLAVWVAIGVLIVFYLLGWFKLEHDSPMEHVGALRLTTAMFFLALTFWLLTGLFGRQLGEIESFLPPSASNGAAMAISGLKLASIETDSSELSWIINDYNVALAQAKRENKLVFVDFTGYTCTNCRWMEINMFPRPEVSRELQKYVRVRLYTDGAGEIYQQQQKLQREKFDTVALPYYAIVDGEGKPISTFPGLTRNLEEFVAFLVRAFPG
jgi:thiol:disulfide interchange protein DsbD